MKTVQWLGNTLSVLRVFPEKVQKSVGFALWQAQKGEIALNVKQMSGLGGGVFEVCDDHGSDTYRAVYIAKLATAVYVLHVFKKKSKKGIRTPQPDMELIRRRLLAAREADSKAQERK